MSETRATARDGQAGRPLVFTGEDVLQEIRALSKREFSAPGPDAVLYEVLEEVVSKTADIVATALTNSCADMGTQDLPRIWAESVLSLIPQARKGGKKNISGSSVSCRSSRKLLLPDSFAKRAPNYLAGRSTCLPILRGAVWTLWLCWLVSSSKKPVNGVNTFRSQKITSRTLSEACSTLTLGTRCRLNSAVAGPSPCPLVGGELWQHLLVR